MDMDKVLEGFECRKFVHYTILVFDNLETNKQVNSEFCKDYIIANYRELMTSNFVWAMRFVHSCLYDGKCIELYQDDVFMFRLSNADDSNHYISTDMKISKIPGPGKFI